MERDRGGRPRHPGIITPAEQRVLEELRKGGTNAEIAVRLGIGPETVKTHISSMLEKLEVESRQDLARWRPDEERRRLLGPFALPGTLAGGGRPLLWAGAGLATAAVAVVAAVALVVLLRGGGESPDALVPLPATGEATTSDETDLRYVRDLCVAGDSYQATQHEGATRWDFDLETSERLFTDRSGEELLQIGLDVVIEPRRSLTAALERASPPSYARDFHTAAVRHRVNGNAVLDELRQRFPAEPGSGSSGEVTLAYTQLVVVIAANERSAPPASVETRRLLFQAAGRVPECDGNWFLRRFLGGGEPTVEAVDPSDEQYLRQVCLAARAYHSFWVDSVFSWVDSTVSEEELGDRIGGPYFFIDGLTELRTHLQSASPPDDVGNVHREYLSLVDEIILIASGEPLVERRLDVAGDYSLGEYSERLTDRVYGGKGDPVAPPAARVRLLAAAESVEECSGTAFLSNFLGRDE